jgi:hypothetical protein
VEDGAFHARHELDDSRFADVLDEPVNDFVTELTVGHLAAAKAQACLDLVSLVQEPDSLIFLGLIVVLVDSDGEFDFLHRNHFLLLAGRSFALFLFVQIAAVILDPADWGDSGRRNLDEVEAAFAGDSQCFKGRQDSELDAIFVDDANFACADAVVDADKGFCRTFVECDDAPPEISRCGVTRARTRRVCGRSEYSIVAVGIEPGKSRTLSGVLSIAKESAVGGEAPGACVNDAVGGH